MLDKINIKDWYPSNIYDKFDTMKWIVNLCLGWVILTFILYVTQILSFADLIISLIIVTSIIGIGTMIGIIFVLDSIKNIR